MIIEKFKLRLFAIVFISALFSFCSSGSWISSQLTANTIDTDNSSSSFVNLMNFASGLTDLWDLIDSRDNVRNINNQDGDELIIHSVRFPGYASSTYDTLGQVPGYDDSNIEAEIIGTPLVYPNPFRQSQNEGAEIQYTLSKDLDLEIHMYNMLAYRVFKQSFEAGSFGARRGVNVLQINNES